MFTVSLLLSLLFVPFIFDEIFGVGFLKVFLRLFFPWFFLIQELPRVALPFLRLLNSVVIIVGMLCAVVYDWTVTKQLNKLPMLFYHNYNCSNRIEHRKNAKYRHYCITHLYEFLCSLKSRKKEKPTFLPIFIVSAKKKLCDSLWIWCAWLHCTVSSLYFIRMINAMWVPFWVFLWCRYSSTCSAQFFFRDPFFMCYYSYLAIVGLNALRIHTYHRNECNETVSRRSRCNYFCRMHFFASLSFSLCFHCSLN